MAMEGLQTLSELLGPCPVGPKRGAAAGCGAAGAVISSYVWARTERDRAKRHSDAIVRPAGGNCMSFWIYLAGYMVLITGLAIGAHLLNVQPQWIGVGVLCLLGIGIVHGVAATRQKDVAS